jgi:thiamine biosynthesis lipoprotein
VVQVLPVLLAALAAAPAEPIALVTETRPSMATLVTVTLAGVDPARAPAALEAAFAPFARVEAVMNEWRADSDLSRLNAAAGGGWISLPSDLCEVLALARAGAERTGGRFDPTWAALADLWRFDGTQSEPPAEAVLGARCPLVGHAGLRLEPEGAACRARLERAGMRVGLGGIAKGWAVDRAAAALRAMGIADFLVQAGGDLYAGGRRGGAPWVVAIRDPRGGPLDGLAGLAVEDAAFSTSGDTEHRFEAGGRRYHHLIDPRTCRPAGGARQVSVLAPSAVEAEIQGKALFVEGGEGALALARQAGVEAVVVDRAGRVLASPGLAGRLLRPRDPSAPGPPPGAPPAR